MKKTKQKPISTISMMIWGNQFSHGPLNVKVSEKVLAEFGAEDYNEDGHHPVEQMFLEWDKSYPQIQFFKIPMAVTENLNYKNLQSFNDNEMGVYINYDWFSDISPSALAITQFYAIKKSTSTLGYLELLHADIILNYKHHTFSMDKNDTESYYLPSVILHEVGHFLGLTHTRNYNIYSIMHPFMGTFESESALPDFDKQTINNNYNFTPSQTFNLPMATAIKKGQKDNNEQIIRGIIELRKNGQCIHYLDGKLIYSH